jgi:hypothetical protein
MDLLCMFHHYMEDEQVITILVSLVFFLIIYYLVVKLWQTDVTVEVLCIQQVKLNNSFFHEWQITIDSTNKRQ